MFAEIVVHLPAVPRAGPPAEPTQRGTSFHYHIPTGLALQIGHLVWVPFGSRFCQGIVISLTDESPVAETKPVLTLVDPQPVLTETQVALARWIADYYLTPLGSVAWLMVPPGIEQRTTPRWVATDTTDTLSSPLSPDEAALLALIRTSGPLDPAVAQRQLGKTIAVRRVAGRLIDQGLVQTILQITPPKVRPKLTRVSYIIVDQEKVREELARLERRHGVRQIALLEALQGYTLPVETTELCKATGASSEALRRLEAKGLVRIEEREVRRDPLSGHTFAANPTLKLTPAQEASLAQIVALLAAGQSGKERPAALLLHGATGSGKTEVYLQALARVLAAGLQAIILVPEIALTPQTIARFAGRFPGRVAVLHSRLTAGQRFDEWRRIRDGLADIVVGSRSAIFAPLPRLGLIVLDEEHEWTYKQSDAAPRYHAREVALHLAKLTGAAVVLGSATPDVTTTWRAQHGAIHLAELPERVVGRRPAGDSQAGGELPPVEIVDMRAELRAGNRSIFSRSLRAALTEVLAAHEQAILFLNRRGSASFVLCRDCGQAIQCSRCAVSLSYHEDENVLICHHCNRRRPVPQQCPNCWSKRIRYFGLGTEKVADEMRMLFPHSRLLRWDRDVTGRQGAHEAILETFASHQADVLIGTQMVAKGLDLPLVTLVGVISADTALHLPDLRAGERTFQLLTQVAGRAGRSERGGRAIIQTYSPEHYAIQAAATHDYHGFYAQEIAFRQSQGYPPFRQLARLVYTHSNADKAETEATRLAAQLQQAVAQAGLAETEVIGPAPAFLSRLQGVYRWQITILAPDVHPLLAPVSFPAGWLVDIDPVSLL